MCKQCVPGAPPFFARARDEANRSETKFEKGASDGNSPPGNLTLPKGGTEFNVL